MTIEDELRGALDVAAPPAKTTLDDVLRRGRRRLFAQRAGAVLGVVAVVAGVGFGTAYVNSAGPSEPASPPPSLTEEPVPPSQTLDWQRVDTPAQRAPQTFRPAATAPPPAGRKILDLTRCDIKFRTLPLTQHVGTVVLPPEFLGRVKAGLQRYAHNTTIGDVQSSANKPDYSFDVSDGGGTGSVRVAAGRFSGTPRAAADEGVWETGDCAPPYRHVLENGTIVQVHEVHGFEPFQSQVQQMTVYRADGVLIQFELRNFGSPDLRPNPKQPQFWERIGAGRETLPMNESQFAVLGLTVAEGA